MRPEPETQTASFVVEREQPHPRSMRVLGYGLAAAVLVLDQIVKYWVINGLRLQERVTIDLLPFFDLTWVENRGVSMGLFTAGSDAGRWMLVAVTALISIGVAFWLRRERNRMDVIALGLVLGGAIGNIIDRVRFGYVVDFLHLFWGEGSILYRLTGMRDFYVFNVADAAITIGVILLLMRALVTREPKQRNVESGS